MSGVTVDYVKSLMACNNELVKTVRAELFMY